MDQSRRRFLKAMGVTGAAGMVGPLAGARRVGAADIVKVGVVFPFTGSLAQTGRLNRSGTELAIEIINNKFPDVNLPFATSEGIPKFGKIQVVWGDTQGDPNVARSEVERLIENERVVAVIGGWTSAEIKTGSQAAERLKTVYISGAGSSTDLTRRGLRYYFRLCPHLGTTAASFYEYIGDLRKMAKTDLKTVAIAYENSEYGSVSFDEFKRAGEERGYQIVAQVPYPKDTASVLAEIMRLKSANPDIFVHAGYVSDSILFTKAMQNQNFLPKVWYGLAGYDDPTYIQNVGKAANGAGLRGFFNPRLRKPVVRQVNDLYSKRNGTELSMASALTFNEPFVLADAIHRAGSLNKDAIRDALEKTNIPGQQTIMPWDAIRFSPYTAPPGHTHDNLNSRNIVFQVQDGKQEIIWPFDVATAKPMFPLPPFDKR